MSSTGRIIERPFCSDTAAMLATTGIHPVMARIFAARGIRSQQQLDTQLGALVPFEQLKNIRAAAAFLAEAIQARKRLLIVADYDADGATACAVGLRALRAFGADVGYLVPNRFEFGYGLTPEIVAVAAQRKPDIIITVDNGIASIEGVAAAQAVGIEVVITDHHLPGDVLPDARVIVNPNQPDCAFPSKCLAGVGVMFYVMLALRATLRERGAFAACPEPNLGHLLDLVALGTVADVVALDDNNRILVENGLKRIRAGRAHAGIQALFEVSRRDSRNATAWDLGFALGPRINAAGRMNDISMGIELLICDDPGRAATLATELDALNRERRSVEAEMQQTALDILESIEIDTRAGVCLHDPDWHQGVVGIVASRIKDKIHRPVIAFARVNDAELKGSGRSIEGFHLRDALDLVSKRHPDLILKFGGHAMAAGISIRAGSFEAFSAAFNRICAETLDPALLERTVATDGELSNDELCCALAATLKRQVWGQAFPAPLFRGRFQVKAQRLVAEKHTKLSLWRDNRLFDAMLFFHDAPLPERVALAYRLEHEIYNGVERAQLVVEHWEADVLYNTGLESGASANRTS